MAGTIEDVRYFLKPRFLFCILDELTDKSKKPNDQLDKVCLDFEHCSECLQVDKCSSDFEPKFNETNFSCDHLPKDSCQCRVYQDLLDSKLASYYEKTETLFEP